MNKKTYVILAGLMLFFNGLCYGGASYYISPTGSDTTGAGTGANPWQTIHRGIAALVGGDTLILKNGTYTGANNVLSRADNAPPIGSAGAYTIIKAENDGGAVLDGENARTMFFFDYIAGQEGARYWRFEGLIFARGSGDTVQILRSSYVKFLRCGAYDAAAGNNVNWNISRCSYFLLENCYAWGTGRYKFIAYHSDHIIFRQCVGRPDSLNPGGEPAAVFAAYASTYVKFQNCIAIDADQTAYWTNVGDRQGSFFVPCTDGMAQYVDFDQSIGLNVKLGGLQTASNTDSADVTFRNIVIWASADAGDTMNMIRGSRNSLLNITWGMNNSADFLYADGSATVLKNSILYKNTITSGNLCYSVDTQDYNSYYGNTNTNNCASGAHDITATNPTTNSLKYLPRIEAGTTLKGAGESGADIGANVLTLIGTPGTLWGEAGYATDTGVSMWPFPSESIIKTKMAAYSGGGVSGARGFAASGLQRNGVDNITLTSYIWEYLGNTMPGSGRFVTSPLITGVTPPQ